jgi:hypothetical protein
VALALGRPLARRQGDIVGFVGAAFPLSAMLWSGRGSTPKSRNAASGTTIAIEKVLLVARWQSTQWQV